MPTRKDVQKTSVAPSGSAQQIKLSIQISLAEPVKFVIQLRYTRSITERVNIQGVQVGHLMPTRLVSVN